MPTFLRVGRLAPVLGLLGLMLVGCDQAASDDEAAQVTAPTAEERYERIVSVLRQSADGRSMTDTSAVNDFGVNAGVPVTNGRMRFEEEMLPPEKEGEPYRATICLSTQSTVTVVLPKPDDSDKLADRAKTKADVEEAKSGLEGIPDMEDLIVPKAEGLRRSLNKSPIHQIESDESKSCFELVFRDGRWELANEIDADEEPLFSMSIEYALKMQ